MPVTLSGRVDDVESGDCSSLVWGFPETHCVLTVVAAENEHFSRFSALYLFALINHIITSVASTRAMIGALENEVEYSREKDLAHLAKTSYLLTLEMEELIDLNIAWPQYDLLPFLA